jgi:penicillin G amidase
MAISPQTYSPPSTTRRNLFRGGLAIIVLLMLVIASGCYWFYSGAKESLPQLDGTIALSGLANQVTVLRDGHGVPTIRATSLEDLFFAQGYVTAQDRLWSMDVYRRFASGDLAAAMGSRYVKRDIYQRTLGFRQVAQRAVAALSPRDRGYLEAYAKGVNAYIQEHQHSLPSEFRVLRYFPRAWTVEDSFLVGTSLIEALNHGYYKSELDREKILAKLGPELTNDLYVNSSFRDIPPGSDAQEIHGEESSDPEEGGGEDGNSKPLTPKKKSKIVTPYTETDELIATLQGGKLRPGSNNWVVSGAHTVSGKPILCNDMHLGHRMPNVWYEAHLISGDYNVVGVTLPGVPFVIVGHNQRIAWGITNLGADVEDVYVENFNGQGEYQTPSGWQKPERRHETIHVIRGKDVEIEVIVTRHGPIISHLLKDESRMLALKSVNWDPLHPMAFPFFDLNIATNWPQFTDALSHFPTPSENFVYADVDGHIGYHGNGLIPIRAAGDGTLPSSGADDTHEWNGYIPFDKLPTVYDPPSGIIATANSRVSPDGYPYSLSTEWVPPYRTERIYRVLQQDKKFVPADMLALQTDVYSSVDRFLAQRFAYAVDHASKPSERARKAADILRRWDGRLSVDSAGGTIARTTRMKFQEMLLQSKLGQDTDLYNWQMDDVWVENTALLEPARWLPAQYSTYADFLTAALEKAIENAPRDLDKWHYGDVFPIELSHDLFGKVPIVKRWAGPGIQPQPGDGTTVWQAGRSFGPSERLTVDFSNFDNSTLNIVNGQSGHLLSPYFNDQWDAWYHGTTFPLPYSEAAYTRTAEHKLTLTPAQ